MREEYHHNNKRAQSRNQDRNYITAHLPHPHPLWCTFRLYNCWRRTTSSRWRRSSNRTRSPTCYILISSISSKWSTCNMRSVRILFMLLMSWFMGRSIWLRAWLISISRRGSLIMLNTLCISISWGMFLRLIPKGYLLIHSSIKMRLDPPNHMCLTKDQKITSLGSWILMFPNPMLYGLIL